jgi:hypothetical protein
MAHRAEQIIDAIVAALRANASSLRVPAASIFPHRSLSLSEDQGELPAIAVNFGDDDPASELGNDNLAFIDSLLSVSIIGYSVDPDEPSVRRALLNQRRYVHAALLADQSLGVGFVIATRYGGAGAPEFDSTTQKIAGSLESRWRVFYRMNITDPGD